MRRANTSRAGRCWSRSLRGPPAAHLGDVWVSVDLQHTTIIYADRPYSARHQKKVNYEVVSTHRQNNRLQLVEKRRIHDIFQDLMVETISISVNISGQMF